MKKCLLFAVCFCLLLGACNVQRSNATPPPNPPKPTPIRTMSPKPVATPTPDPDTPNKVPIALYTRQPVAYVPTPKPTPFSPYVGTNRDVRKAIFGMQVKDRLGTIYPIFDIENDTYGFIDAKGNLIFSTQSFCYVEAVYPDGNKASSVIGYIVSRFLPDFNNETMVDEDDTMGSATYGSESAYLSYDGHFILPFSSDGLESFDRIIYRWTADSSGERYYSKCYDLNGKLIFASTKDTQLQSYFHDGLALAKKATRFAYIKIDGSQAFKGLFDEASVFTTDHTVVRVGNQYGIINTLGQYTFALQPLMLYPCNIRKSILANDVSDEPQEQLPDLQQDLFVMTDTANKNLVDFDGTKLLSRPVTEDYSDDFFTVGNFILDAEFNGNLYTLEGKLLDTGIYNVVESRDRQSIISFKADEKQTSDDGYLTIGNMLTCFDIKGKILFQSNQEFHIDKSILPTIGLCFSGADGNAYYLAPNGEILTYQDADYIAPYENGGYIVYQTKEENGYENRITTIKNAKNQVLLSLDTNEIEYLSCRFGGWFWLVYRHSVGAYDILFLHTGLPIKDGKMLLNKSFDRAFYTDAPFICVQKGSFIGAVDANGNWVYCQSIAPLLADE